VEVQREAICSVSALPLESDLFEWHVNIKPVDGVYSGVYFHLIMRFPDDYPSSPPTVEIKTPISHPNIFGDFLCLSMIRKYTATTPYEGWSGAYSVASILMQLQSFLFAEKIDQDGGYTANALLSDQDVKRSLDCCTTLQCKCGHSHSTPWPPVKGPPDSLIRVFPTDPRSGHVRVQGSDCQTTHTYWVGAYGEYGVCRGRVQYEVFINWTGDKWRRDNIRGGLCRFGFGSQNAVVCGRDRESFGYGGTGMFSTDNSFEKFGESFGNKDTITVAVDFEAQRIFFAKNGQLMRWPAAAAHVLPEMYIPAALQGVALYPILSFKNSRAEFNFGAPRTPCQWLQDNGFRTLEDVASEEMGDANDGDTDPAATKWTSGPNVDWFHEAIIPELWLSVFCGLSVEELFRAKFVCKAWHSVISKYNISERISMRCFFTKQRLDRKTTVLGIGLEVVRSLGSVEVRSQMDILSETAWLSGVGTGVWGERLTHFLPLVMNRRHGFQNEHKIRHYLFQLHRAVYSPPRRVSRGGAKELDEMLGGSAPLRLVDSLVTMMNQIVVQFVMDSEKAGGSEAHSISMRFCEKTVVGYCALHHLLLWLQKHHRRDVDRFVDRMMAIFMKQGTAKTMVRDLGKFLIYLMASRRTRWQHVAPRFVREVMTRNVRWMVADRKYSRFDTTAAVNGRLKATFKATATSRRLVQFQVYFMRNCSAETLGSYNERLGRPRNSFRNAVLRKTRAILDSKRWSEYFEGLGLAPLSNNELDQLLRFAVGNSRKNGYHGRGPPGPQLKPPQIRMARPPRKQTAVGDRSLPRRSGRGAADQGPAERMNYLQNRPSAFPAVDSSADSAGNGNVSDHGVASQGAAERMNYLRNRPSAFSTVRSSANPTGNGKAAAPGTTQQAVPSRPSPTVQRTAAIRPSGPNALNISIRPPRPPSAPSKDTVQRGTEGLLQPEEMQREGTGAGLKPLSKGQRRRMRKKANKQKNNK